MLLKFLQYDYNSWVQREFSDQYVSINPQAVIAVTEKTVSPNRVRRNLAELRLCDGSTIIVRDDDRTVANKINEQQIVEGLEPLQ